MRQWRPGGYLRASWKLLVWLLVRAGIQVVMVVTMARALGAVDYGTFVAALAVASFFTPLAGLGLGVVVLRDGAADAQRADVLLRSAAPMFGRYLFLWVPLAVGAVLWAVPQARLAPLCFAVLAIGEVFGTGAVELIARWQQVRESVTAFGATLCTLAFARLAAVAAAIGLSTGVEAAEIALAYGLASLGYAAALWLRRRAVWASSDQVLPISVGDGLPFVTGALALRLQAELNKPLLVRADAAGAGMLNVVQRIIDLATLPLQALQEALWPRLFGHLDALRRLTLTGGFVLVCALAIGAVLWFSAPALPYLFGASFAGSVDALMMLAAMPAVQTLRGFANSAVIACGHSHRLSAVYLCAALMGAVAAVVLIGRFGLPGAVAAMYASELALILFCSLAATPCSWMRR